jgi:diketogulonate reductase-like aldo/keto reductase
MKSCSYWNHRIDNSATNQCLLIKLDSLRALTAHQVLPVTVQYSKILSMHTLALNDGNQMPILGLGTWQADPGVVGEAVRVALMEAEYQHIDCAAIYGNEKEIGNTFHDVFTRQRKPRENIFITSKLWNTEHHPDKVEAACRKTLSDLQLDYLDLYLIHWGLAFDSSTGEPRPVDEQGRIKTERVPLTATWQAMEQLVHSGLVKSIGVANFTTVQLLDLLASAQIKPVMNQVELHPYLNQQALVDFCHHYDVAVTAYSPLGAPGGAGKNLPSLLSDSTIIAIATTHQKTPAQVILRWGMQRQTIVIPKSVTPQRIIENAQLFDFELTPEEMQQITSLNRNQRAVDPAQMWGMPYFA